MSGAVTSSVIATLEAGGLTVGDANNTSRIDGQGNKLTPPYVVVYPIAGDTYDGSIGDTWGEIDKPLQVTCVGESRTAAEILADRVQDLLLAATGVDWQARPRGGGGVARDDDTADAPLFYAYPRFTLRAWR